VQCSAVAVTAHMRDRAPSDQQTAEPGSDIWRQHRALPAGRTHYTAAAAGNAPLPPAVNHHHLPRHRGGLLRRHAYCSEDRDPTDCSARMQRPSRKSPLKPTSSSHPATPPARLLLPVPLPPQVPQAATLPAAAEHLGCPPTCAVDTLTPTSLLLPHTLRVANSTLQIHHVGHVYGRPAAPAPLSRSETADDSLHRIQGHPQYRLTPARCNSKPVLSSPGHCAPRPAALGASPRLQSPLSNSWRAGHHEVQQHCDLLPQEVPEGAARMAGDGRVWRPGPRWPHMQAHLGSLNALGRRPAPWARPRHVCSPLPPLPPAAGALHCALQPAAQAYERAAVR
jgi:hypothetical protein